MPLGQDYEALKECPCCGFTGNVVVEPRPHVERWECPRCREVHDDPFEEGPDPDEAYDAARDDPW